MTWHDILKAPKKKKNIEKDVDLVSGKNDTILEIDYTSVTLQKDLQ